MLKNQVVIGGVYRVRWHDGSFTNVQILGLKSRGTRVGYNARNLSTGRDVVIKSAAKLRERVG